jgi:polyhydroxyalkanoate synthesis regulator protein
MAAAGTSALRLMDEQVQQNIKFFEATLSNFSSFRPEAKLSEPDETKEAAS